MAIKKARITPENVASVSSIEDKKEVKAKVEFPYVCDICGKAFKTQFALSGHSRSHKEKIEEAVEEPKDVLPSVDPLKWVTKYALRVISNRPLIEKLAKEDKVTFIIPLAAGESKAAVMEAQINGQSFAYPKGVYFEAPRSIVSLLMNSIQAEASAGSAKLIDRSEEVRDILS